MALLKNRRISSSLPRAMVSRVFVRAFNYTSISSKIWVWLATQIFSHMVGVRGRHPGDILKAPGGNCAQGFILIVQIFHQVHQRGCDHRRQVADRSHRKIVFLIRKDHGESADAFYKGLELRHPETGNRLRGSEDIKSIFQHVGRGIFVSHMLCAAHGVAADKMLFQFRILMNVFVNPVFDTAHIGQQHIVMENAG